MRGRWFKSWCDECFLFVRVILVLCSSLSNTHMKGNVLTRQLNTIRAFQIKGSLANMFAGHIWRFSVCHVNQEIVLRFVNCVGYRQKHPQNSIIFAGVNTKAGHKRIVCMETWNWPHSLVRHTASSHREHLQGPSATAGGRPEKLRGGGGFVYRFSPPPAACGKGSPHPDGK